MTVTVLRRAARPGISAARLRRVVDHVLRREGAPRGAAVAVVLVSDREIRTLNRRFLRTDRPTDVLAFAADGGTRGRGEVVVSVDRARIQARAAGHAPGTEVALLAAHGVLHLLGHDDRTAAGRTAMMRRQRALLGELGLQVRG